MVSRAPVAHACNPSYSRGRDQLRQIVPWDPISKNPIKEGADIVAQGLGPEFKPQYCKKKTQKLKYSVRCGGAHLLSQKLRGWGRRIMSSKPVWLHSETLSQKRKVSALDASPRVWAGTMWETWSKCPQAKAHGPKSDWLFLAYKLRMF
jgi:hypothetical protein